MENMPEYTYEQLATLVVQLQGLNKTLGEELAKANAEKVILQEKMLLIKKIVE